MVMSPTHGLADRLQNVFAFLEEARRKGEILSLHWVDNWACKGNFNNLFAPISGLEVIPAPPDYQGPKVDRNRNLDRSEWEMISKELKPSPMIEHKVNVWKEKLGGDYIALHVRRTDFPSHMEFHFGVDIQKESGFCEFIDSCPPDTKIFLATDNILTQQFFRSQYGNRVFCHEIIFPDSFRQTPLWTSVVDMYVCAGARAFLGTSGSGFSKVILALRKEVDKIFEPYYNFNYDFSRKTSET